MNYKEFMDALLTKANEIIMTASIYNHKSEIPKWIIQLNERLIRIEQMADSLDRERLQIHSLLDQQKAQLQSMIDRIPPHLFGSEKPADSEKCESDKDTVVDDQSANTVGRIQLEKLNQQIDQLYLLFKDKAELLSIPQTKMTRLQRDLFWEHRESNTDETRDRPFILESDLREHKWSTSKFTFNATGRNVITILRHLGRIKEIRGKGKTRIVLVQ